MATSPTAAPLDRGLLVEFLTTLRSVLEDSLRDPQRAPWFLTALYDPLLGGWDDVQPSFDMAIRYLSEPPDPNLLDAQLAHAGFKDRLLPLKISGAVRAFDRLRGEGTKLAFKSVLGWANIILGSLGGIVPGIESIKEYKEVCEQAVEDADNFGADDSGDNENDPGPRTFQPPPEFDI